MPRPPSNRRWRPGRLAATASLAAALCSGCAGIAPPDGAKLIDRMRVDGGGLLLDAEFGETPHSAPSRRHLRLGVIREPDTRNRFATPDAGSGLAKRRPPMRRTPIKVEIE